MTAKTALAPDPRKLKRKCSMAIGAVEKVAGKERTYRFVASTPSVDRAGDIIEPNWDLDNFRRTGMPILWCHDYFLPPIGKGVSVGVEGQNLIIEMQFAPREKYAKAGEIQDLVDIGILSCVSVGFRPVDFSYMEKGGMRITKAELFEISIVSVPANAEAVIQSKGALRPVYAAGSIRSRSEMLKGCDAAAVTRWFKEAPMKRAVTITSSKSKATPPPAPDEDMEPDAEPGAEPTGVEGMCDQVIAALEKAMADGTITTEEVQAIIALLNQIKETAMGDGGDEPDEEEGDTPAPPPAKAADLVEQVRKALAPEFERILSIASRRDAELPEINEPLEVAFASPDAMTGFSQTLG